MEKTVYIHTGGPKTGTTALQHFLASNRQALEKKGFLYPGTGFDHKAICGELKDIPAATIRTLPGTSMMALIGEIERSRCPVSIISAECLAIFDAAGKLRELLPSRWQVKIVYFARRQDDLFESRYNEFVKSGWYLVKERLDDELVDSFYQRPDFDHARVLAPWTTAFGRENVIVRCYERQQMPDGIIGAFLALIGLPCDPSLKIPSGRENRSLDIHHTEFLRLCNCSFEAMPDMNDYLYWMHFRNAAAFRHLPARHRLSPGTRRAILEYYRESNARVAREYLGREDGHLFYAAWPGPDEHFEPYEGITAEELVPILAEMVRTAETRQERRLQDLQPLIACLEVLNYFLKKGLQFIPSGIRWRIQQKTDRWYRRI